jgi:hypothetical protein
MATKEDADTEYREFLSEEEEDELEEELYDDWF